MDTLITVTIVAAAALWAALRLFRRRRPGACGGACSGCPAARSTTGGNACAPVPSGRSLPGWNDGGR
ncbi:MAG TPA: FeoB-associated Cys-rich membrane protein [Thermoanaerobaculia bacterium]|nr:FeoB-associated Cys-rich membrane protein [Thermoanaerobaculia bacterium]HQN06784.1 FeoB-associated Cys-rich membrane protein [Thermoanaerobaculia bacterium]HQP84960.1 FeoB-associated Cys-rich membrane protein [Thermoanaerobaculia bacterium]